MLHLCGHMVALLWLFKEPHTDTVQNAGLKQLGVIG